MTSAPRLLEKDLVWEYFRASGPGGQRRNKVATAVRLIHQPTGICVTATERRLRSQNRVVALKRLQKRLAELNRPRRPRKPTRPSQAARQRRLEAKKAQARRKQLRKKPRRDDWD